MKPLWCERIHRKQNHKVILRPAWDDFLSLLGIAVFHGGQPGEPLELAAEMGHISVAKLLSQMGDGFVGVAEAGSGCIDPGTDQIVYRGDAKSGPIQMFSLTVSKTK